MADNTRISWANITHNWLAWCEKVSPECANCYAIGTSIFTTNMGSTKYAGVAHRPNGKREQWVPGLGVRVDYNAMMKGIPGGPKRRFIFVNSMSDTFHDSVPHSALAMYMDKVVARHPQHVFMFLTKRADNMLAWAQSFGLEQRMRKGEFQNCMWGITAGVQESLNSRLPFLLQMPGTRWVSAEPLLAPVNLPPEAVGLHYLVVGGESGKRARPMHPTDAHRLVGQAQELGIPVHFKQWGEWIGTQELTAAQQEMADSGKYKTTGVGGNVSMVRLGKQHTLVDGDALLGGRVIHEEPLLEPVQKARRLWALLGDVPVDDDECLEQPFLDFEAGTHREDVWWWFEEEFGVSVYRELMFPQEGGKA